MNEQKYLEIHRRAEMMTGKMGTGALIHYIDQLEGVVIDCEQAFTSRRSRRPRRDIHRTFDSIRVALMVAKVRRRHEP